MSSGFLQTLCLRQLAIADNLLDEGSQVRGVLAIETVEHRRISSADPIPDFAITRQLRSPLLYSGRGPKRFTGFVEICGSARSALPFPAGYWIPAGLAIARDAKFRQDQRSRKPNLCRRAGHAGQHSIPGDNEQFPFRPPAPPRRT